MFTINSKLSRIVLSIFSHLLWTIGIIFSWYIISQSIISYRHGIIFENQALLIISILYLLFSCTLNTFQLFHLTYFGINILIDQFINKFGNLAKGIFYIKYQDNKYKIFYKFNKFSLFNCDLSYYYNYDYHCFAIDHNWEFNTEKEALIKLQNVFEKRKKYLENKLQSNNIINKVANQEQINKINNKLNFINSLIIA